MPDKRSVTSSEEVFRRVRDTDRRAGSFDAFQSTGGATDGVRSRRNDSSETTPHGVIGIGESLPEQSCSMSTASRRRSCSATGPRTCLVFYRGFWCPFCNIALHAYQRDLLPALSERAIRLVAVSPQRPDGSLTMQEKNELTFTVLWTLVPRSRPPRGSSPPRLRPRRPARSRPRSHRGQCRRHDHPADADNGDPRPGRDGALDRRAPRLRNPLRAGGHP